MKKVIINPIIDVPYASYFIIGLQSVFGRKNVSFAKSSQLKLFIKQKKVLNISFLVIDSSTSETLKVSIDHGDFNTILDKSTYEWANIYGKVNTNWKLTPKEQFPKLICLATNFGIRGLSCLESIYYSIRNYFAFRPKEIKGHFAKYYKQNNKLWIDGYPLSNSEKGYIFSANTLWYSDKYNRLNETTNKIRADFMETCLSMSDICFEGGFIPSQLGNENYKHLHLKKSLSQSAYIDKLKKSIFAFNTPAVWNCHGWKLGEYLCMGKAIISTPLSNDLPAPLIHGEMIHIVNNQQELIEAIQLLNENDAYRMKLEKNARNYYEKFVSPEASIRLLGID
ncbi:MAG: hypothetical protein Q8904_13880 [Bacteroidota bacterium]|nr:hypothetical protein [Bacteroidota bacterium]